ncbi:gamma-butyrobetaine hydroxylase-like domain-containing protein [Rheinheimera sp. FR7-31]|uniref:gamma-butyrobetaine hydroxylase-like domain-containing protein n=1 Tax=Rheinheimera fenheensis TaxID=3152295 RepID=UPI00325CE4B9
MASNAPSTDTDIQVSRLHYHQRSRKLDVEFNNGETASLSAELLRVLSPSAEVRRHGKPMLVTNKKNVAISKVLPVGHYAVKLVFDDGLDSGIYSWRYLHQLATQQDSLWQQYLTQLRQANAQRDELIAVTLKP